MEVAVKEGSKTDVEGVLSAIQERLKPQDYYAYEEATKSIQRIPGRPIPAPTVKTGLATRPIPAATRTSPAAAPAREISQPSIPGLTPEETFTLTSRKAKPYKKPAETIPQQESLFEKSEKPYGKGPVFHSGVDITKTVEVVKAIRDDITSSAKKRKVVLPTGDATILQRLWNNPHWYAKKNPEFKPAYDVEMKREENRSVLLDQRLAGWDSVRQLNKEDLDILNKILWTIEGRKLKGIDAERFVYEENEAGQEIITKLNNKHYQQIVDHLKAKNPKIPDEVFKALVDVRKNFDRSQAMIHNFLATSKDVEPETVEAYRKSMGEIPNYLPHTWKGNYYFHGLNEAGDVVARVQYYDAAPGGYSIRHKGQLKQAKLQYPEATKWTAPKKITQIPEEFFEYSIPLDAMQQIIDAGVDRLRGVDPAAAEIFRSSLPEATTDVIKSRGFGSRMIKRKNVQGYEKSDLQRLLYDFDSSFSGWYTKIQAANKFSDALFKLHGAKKPNLYAYTSRYIKDVMANSDRIDNIVDGLRTYFYLDYMGGIAKSGIVNLTQNLITGTERLYIDVGINAGRYFKHAGDDIIAGITKNKNLTPDEVDLLNELYHKGITQAQQLKEVQGQIAGPAGAAVNNIASAAGIFMGISERFNRTSLALSAYRLARDGKIDNPKTLKKLGLEKRQNADYETAMKFAKDIVEDAHLVYGKGNMPELLRGRTKILRPLYSLASFGHQIMQLWAWMLRQGGRGMAAFSMSMMAQGILGGIKSLPFILPLFAAWRQVYGTDPQKELRDRLPENVKDIATYGLPSLMGINIGGSLQIGDIDMSNPAKFIIGVPYSKVQAIGKAKAAWQSGQQGRAIEELAPKVIAHPMGAYRLATEGQRSISGQPINFPGETEPRKINKLEAIGKVFGFQPLSSTKASDTSKAMADLESFVERKQKIWANQYANAYNNDNLAGMSKVQTEVESWNKRWDNAGKPEYMIRLSDAIKTRLRPRATPKKFRNLGEEYKESYR